MLDMGQIYVSQDIVYDCPLRRQACESVGFITEEAIICFSIRTLLLGHVRLD
jgi:hypothetical protein